MGIMGFPFSASLIISKCKSLHSILFISDTISDTLQSFSGGFGECQDDCNGTPDLPIGAELDSKASQLRCKVTPGSHGESRKTHCFQDASEATRVLSPKVMVDWLVISRYDAHRKIGRAHV